MRDAEDGTGDGPDVGRPVRPLRVAALVKQVPVIESLALGADGRLRRRGTPLEMNPYCRRAVSKATELARSSGGTCTVLTLGPPSAEDVLREALAWGADEAVHLSDPAFAGSDTLATARALAAALVREGPFDLVLVGRSSTDGDTGQVGPELAELLDLPFAAGVRRLRFAGDVLQLGLEQDDGWEEVEVALPALLSVAERLCDPCKVDPEGRRAVTADRIRQLWAADLGDGPWGDAGSPTRVGAVRALPRQREGRRLSGDLATQVGEAVQLLVDRGALDRTRRPAAVSAGPGQAAARPARAPVAVEGGVEAGADHRVVLALLEPGRPQVAPELLGAAARLAAEVGGEVVAAVPPAASPASAPSATAVEAVHRGGAGRAAETAVAPGVTAGAGDESLARALGALGADRVLQLVGVDGGPGPAAEDVATALSGWARGETPWMVLAPSTAFGREVAARVAAALGAGLVGDAVAVEVVDGGLVAAKPAFAGALVADVTCTSAVQLVTVRPGVLPVPPPRPGSARLSRLRVVRRGRVRSRSVRRDDDVEVLARADVVIGVGTGVAPDEYAQLSALAAVLGAELAATRKVTDRGWAPRSRQVGVTGRSIAPRLYVAVGLSGKFNHMVGVRAAGTVLAVNPDPTAPVFSHADVGVVGDWHQVVPLLTEALRDRGVAAGGRTSVGAGRSV